MIVTTKTTVTFRLPQDYELLNAFLKSNDMSEWTEYISTEWISYSHQQTVAIGVKEEGAE